MVEEGGGDKGWWRWEKGWRRRKVEVGEGMVEEGGGRGEGMAEEGGGEKGW